jgi:hypothetical protein
MKIRIAAYMLVLLTFAIPCSYAQTSQGQNLNQKNVQTGVSAPVYQIPFASSGNSLELAVANTAANVMAGIRVQVTNVPSWLKFNTTEQQIALIKPQQECPATFIFSVDKTAPVKESHALRFVIFAPNGDQWIKEINVAIAAPEKFEAYNNYPNPFNPTTTISYQLTTDSRVRLRIFNLLGQEVASVVDGDRLAGYHQEVWDASRFSSGMYIYQLVATDEHGAKQVARKRMILLK